MVRVDPLGVRLQLPPNTAVNSTEMWQTFDPATIERELQLAAGLGYNTVRVFLQFMVWEADPEGHKERLEIFLRLADGAGASMMPILFDDCRFDDRDPYPGRQDEPKPGVHNSRWTPSPGYATADDPARWPQLEAYVSDLVGSFGNDRRVLVWDLYNEPGGASTAWARVCCCWPTPARSTTAIARPATSSSPIPTTIRFSGARRLLPTACSTSGPGTRTWRSRGMPARRSTRSWTGRSTCSWSRPDPAARRIHSGADGQRPSHHPALLHLLGNRVDRAAYAGGGLRPRRAGRVGARRNRLRATRR